MPEIINFKATCRPTGLMRTMLEHSGDVSEGTSARVIAKRVILGKVVTFLANGLHFVEKTDLKEDEMFDSEILRLAHASILINEPVGDRRLCYVDATKNPVEIWIYDMPIEAFLKRSKRLVETQQLDLEFLLEEPVRKTVRLKNERNGRLFRRQSCNTHFPHV